MKKARQENRKIKEEKKEMQEEKDINKAPLNTLLRVDFTYGKESLEGFLLTRGEVWSLFQCVPADYQVDGFVLVNNSHIRKWTRSEREVFKEEVIRLKHLTLGRYAEISCSDTHQLFKQLSEYKLVQIDNHRNDVTYVGKIVGIRDKSCWVKLLSPRARWLEERRFEYNRIWMIYFENDYLTSLISYLENQDSKL